MKKNKLQEQDNLVGEDEPSSTLGKVIRIVVYVVLTIHLLVAGHLFLNAASADVLTGWDSLMMQTYVQFARGSHSYFFADPYRVSISYTPLAGEIFGWSIRIFGESIKVIRVVGALFGLGLMALMYKLTFMMTQNRLLAYACFCLGFSIEPGWFMDIGPNGIHVLFTLLSFYFVFIETRGRSKTFVFLLGAFFAFCSFWSKQTGIVYVAAYLLCVFIKDWKRGLLSSIFILALAAVGVWRYNNLPDSHFLYWFTETANQPLILERLFEPVFFPLLFGRYVIFIALIGGGLLLTLKHPVELLKPQLVYLGAACVVGCVASLKYGSGIIQAWAFFVFILLNAFSYSCVLMQKKQISTHLFLVLLLFQSFSFFQRYDHLLHNKEDEQRFEWIKSVLSTPGKTTYYINQGYLTYMLRGYEFGNVAFDCWKDKVYDRNNYPQSLREFVQSDPFDLVIIDVPLEDGSFALYERLNIAYELKHELPAARIMPNSNSLRSRKLVFERK